MALPLARYHPTNLPGGMKGHSQGFPTLLTLGLAYLDLGLILLEYYKHVTELFITSQTISC